MTGRILNLEFHIREQVRLFNTTVLVIANISTVILNQFLLRVLHHAEGNQTMQFLRHPVGALVANHVVIAVVTHTKFASTLTQYLLYHTFLCVKVRQLALVALISSLSVFQSFESYTGTNLVNFCNSLCQLTALS